MSGFPFLRICCFAVLKSRARDSISRFVGPSVAVSSEPATYGDRPCCKGIFAEISETWILKPSLGGAPQLL